MAKVTYPATKRLTVIIRDDGPMIHCADSPTYRSVTLELTPEQMKQLFLMHTHHTGGEDYYETVSRCFLEPEVSR